MKLVNIFSGMFIFLFAVSSCQKEIVPLDLFMGKDYKATITPINTLVTEACYDTENVTELDVDNNGKPDLKFYTYAVDSLGDQHKRGSSVWSLDGDIEFGYKVAYEELYSVEKEVNEVKREIIFNERSHYNCVNCQNLSVRKDRSTFSSPVLLREGSKLSKNIKWSDKLQILSQLDQSRQYSKETDNTLVYNNILTGIWDENGEGYLPFRIKYGFGQYKYGWIKLRVIDHRRIEFFEIGLSNEISEL